MLGLALASGQALDRVPVALGDVDPGELGHDHRVVGDLAQQRAERLARLVDAPLPGEVLGAMQPIHAVGGERRDGMLADRGLRDVHQQRPVTQEIVRAVRLGSNLPGSDDRQSDERGDHGSGSHLGLPFNLLR